MHFPQSKTKVTEQDMIAADKEFRERNVLSYSDVWDFLGYLHNPIVSITNNMLYLMAFENQFNYASADAAKVWQKHIENTYAEYFSSGVRHSEDWKDLLYLSGINRGDCGFGIVEVFSTSTAISGTFYFNLYERSGGFAAAIFDAEIRKQVDGGWKITKIANPRLYLDISSLQAAEPETCNRIWLMKDGYIHRYLHVGYFD